MKIAIYLINQHPTGADMLSALQDQITLVHSARDAGWDGFFSGQHYLNEGDNQQLQLVPFLARLAPEVGEMDLGLGILLLTLQSPVYVAETTASLDVISKGRLICGFGFGYRAVEFDAFGVPKEGRAQRFESYLSVVRDLWRGEAVTFEDTACRLEGVTMNLRPMQKPGPPVWLAGNSDHAVRRAARLGDTWFINPHGTLETTRRQVALYRKELRRLGKALPREFPAMREIFCARSRQEALELAGPYLAGKYQTYAKWGQERVMPEGESLQQSITQLMKDRFILGSPDECIEQLRPYCDELNVNYLVLRVHWAGMPLSMSMRSMRLISDEVLPVLRGTGFSQPAS